MKLVILVLSLIAAVVSSLQIPTISSYDDCPEDEKTNEEFVMPERFTGFDDKCFQTSSSEEDGVIIDGDIMVSNEQAAIYYESGWDGLVESEAWENTKRWGKKIPYSVTASDTKSTEVKGILKNLEDSMKEIEKNTCIKFFKAKCYHYTRLSFTVGKDRKCYTVGLGRPNFGKKEISLGFKCGGEPCRAMTPAHEIMHAMGRYHEHTRPDRDTYVTISPTNKCPDQMKKQSKASTNGIEYDYYSVMHYSAAQCATKTSLSFTLKKPGRLRSVGQRNYLSKKDIQHINTIHCASKMMRLVGGQDNSEGRLEVNNEEVWGTVCSDGFDRNDANVVCKYLGRPGVEEVYSAADILNIESAQDSPIWLSDLECNGQEDNPFHCSQKVMKHHANCDHNQDVAIKCSKAARLVGGNDNSGRLEVYHEGQWGSVCSHKFHYPEANVACRMMGYSSAVQVFTNVESEYDDTVDNKIVLSQLTCDGTENHLSDCDYSHSAARGCQGGKTVHLECSYWYVSHQ